MLQPYAELVASIGEDSSVSDALDYFKAAGSGCLLLMVHKHLLPFCFEGEEGNASCSPSDPKNVFFSTELT